MIDINELPATGGLLIQTYRNMRTMKPQIGKLREKTILEVERAAAYLNLHYEIVSYAVYHFRTSNLKAGNGVQLLVRYNHETPERIGQFCYLLIKGLKDYSLRINFQQYLEGFDD